VAVAERARRGLPRQPPTSLDLPVATGLSRVGKRGEHDRLESETLEFHERVRAGYLKMIAEEPGRWLTVDGDGSPDEVTARLQSALEARGVELLKSHGVS